MNLQKLQNTAKDINSTIKLASKDIKTRRSLNLPTELRYMLQPTVTGAPAGTDLSSTKIQPRDGRCYELAAEFLIQGNKTWYLVHGTIYPPLGPFMDKPYDHAWCTNGRIVYDPVLNIFCTEDEYKRAFLPENTKRYSYKQMIGKMRQTGHYGPW